MKKIVIDARSIYEHIDGLGIYSLFFINRILEELHDKVHFIIIVAPSAKHMNLFSYNIIGRCQIIYADKECFGNYEYAFGEWDATISRMHPDIYLSTAFFQTNYKCVKAVVIHDLIPIVSPKLRREKRIFYSKVISSAVNNSDLIIVPSLYTKEELNKYYGNIKAPIKVLYPDIEYAMKRLYKSKTKNSHGRFIMLGVKCPRKNVELVIEALKILKKKDITDCKVYFVGKTREKDVSLSILVKDNSIDDLSHVLGYVSDDILADLISGSNGLIYPSLYEGFGIPIIEFLSCYKPVICIRTTSIEEVAGNCAYYIENDPEALANAMLQCHSFQGNDAWYLTIENHLNHLVSANREQYDDFFNWVREHL